MIVGIGILPAVVLCFEIGITIEITAKKFSRNISIFAFYLLRFPLYLGVLAPQTLC